MTPGWVRSLGGTKRCFSQTPNRSVTDDQGQTMIPLQVDLALLIGPLLLRADISFHLASCLPACPVRAADGSRATAYFVLGFVKVKRRYCANHCPPRWFGARKRAAWRRRRNVPCARVDQLVARRRSCFQVPIHLFRIGCHCAECSITLSGTLCTVISALSSFALRGPAE